VTTTAIAMPVARGRQRGARALDRYVVPAAVAVAVVVRLPFLAAPAGQDEAGFLIVGGQWHAGGGSLYGRYWVDRPPLLISIFELADRLGGLVALRVIGAGAVALVVLGSARVAGRLGGPRAARWSAMTAALMCTTPLLGGLTVNGELLAAPFVVWGIAASLTAIEDPRKRRAALAAAGAGAAAVLALLVKQNFADVAVFVTALVALSWLRREVRWSRVWRVVLMAAAGAVAALALVAAWTVLHGTSLRGVFDAMYPFRLQAAELITRSEDQHMESRASLLLAGWVLSGIALVMLLILAALLSRRLRGSEVWALAAMLVFDVASITAGGNYWSHYLVQLVVPVSLLAGLLVSRSQVGARPVLVLSALVALAAWSAVLLTPPPEYGDEVGHAIARVADPHDTLVSVMGHPDVVRSSGLASPYPYLWSLPARILDRHRTVLDGLLAGPDRPTWFVTWGRARAAGRRTARLVRQEYHPVATRDGHTVYLLDGVARATPRLPIPHNFVLSRLVDPVAKDI
jgi:hypothetical protein